MKKYLALFLMVVVVFGFCSCGSESEEPTAYEPTDIQVEDADGVNVYFVLYDLDYSDTDAWSGYDTDTQCVETAISGIKACMARDDWSDDSIVYGYAQEPKLSNMLYQYGYNGIDGDWNSIRLFQVGIYNESYTLQGELD